jgi:CheY-like chemotaxis protein
MNLLHVADDVKEREALTASLRALGHEVASVRAGLEACRRVRNGKGLDAILLSLGPSLSRSVLFRRWLLRHPQLAIPMLVLAPVSVMPGWRADFERCLLLKQPVHLGELQYALSQFEPRLAAAAP